jgi:endonuclease/exonuclease/phosphatase family metal-dependent hydrolase
VKFSPSFVYISLFPIFVAANKRGIMIYASIRKIKDVDERNRIINKLQLLRSQLDKEIPEKTANNTLLLATWNIREFGDNRKPESLYYIAEIISRFDLVAIQEVAGNKKGLEKVMALLGKDYNYIATDSTEGSAGGQECMAFVFNTNKVSFKNMAGEIVLPKDKLLESLQFARTPFCVSFQAGWFKFNLSTVHIYYGKSSGVDPQRLKEIEGIAKFLTKRATKENFNYVLLGDFNINKVDGDYMQALEKNGFYIPNAIKKHPTDLGQTKHYDQIAFNLQLTDTMKVFQEKEQKSGSFNFTKSVYTENDLPTYLPFFDKKYVENKTDKQIMQYYKTKYRTFQMSDHLPLWVELKVDFSEQYLEDLKQGATSNELPNIE